jgi:hypothetical protein
LDFEDILKKLGVENGAQQPTPSVVTSATEKPIRIFILLC